MDGDGVASTSDQDAGGVFFMSFLIELDPPVNAMPLSTTPSVYSG